MPFTHTHTPQNKIMATNRQILKNHNSDMMRVRICGYDHVRRDTKDIWMSPERKRQQMRSDVIEHDPGMCPTYQMVDMCRRWVQQKMRLNAGHPTDQSQDTYIDPITHEVRPVSFEVGITIDGYWVNTRNRTFYKWIFDTAMFYNTVPKFLEYIEAPRALVQDCRHWTRRPRDYKDFNVEQSVRNYIQTHARTSLAYRPHFEQRSSDGALKLVGISNLELSFVKNPRYVACEVLIANSAGLENKLGDTRPLLDSHSKIRRMTEPNDQSQEQQPEGVNTDEVKGPLETQGQDVEPQPRPTYGDVQDVLKVRNGLDVPDSMLEHEETRAFVLQVNQVLADHHKKEQVRRTKIVNEGMPCVVEAMKKCTAPESESQKLEKILNDIVINSSDGPSDPLWIVMRAMSEHMCSDPSEQPTRKRKQPGEVHNETSSGGLPSTIPHPELHNDDDDILVNSASRRRKRRKLTEVVKNLSNISAVPNMQAESMKYLQTRQRLGKKN